MRKLSQGKLKFFLFPLIAVIVIFAVVLSIVLSPEPSISVKAEDLMKDIHASNISTSILSEDFIKSEADFSIELFKKSIEKGKNTLISPTSVYLALAMAANGSDGDTLKEFKTVLGKYDLTLDDINKYSRSYAKGLQDIDEGKLNIANSIWYDNNRLIGGVSREFLQTNADYFGSAAYMEDFSSRAAVDKMNGWVKDNTEGLIEKIIDEIKPDEVMHLINAVYFDQKWLQEYYENDVENGKFLNGSGKMQTVNYMQSHEKNLIKTDDAIGFIKPYKNEKFSFVAILPKKEISAEEYANSLSGKEFLSIIKNAQKNVPGLTAYLPKFESEFSLSMKEALGSIGLKNAFSTEANFGKMTLEKQSLFISDVFHKTRIKVNEIGTEAAAVTDIPFAMAISPPKVFVIKLDRPFVYGIVDNETNLPLFIGIMNDPQE